MKRKDLIRHLEEAGCYLKHHGKNHDMYENPRTGRKALVPKHTEIRESLCFLIKKRLGLLD